MSIKKTFELKVHRKIIVVRCNNHVQHTTALWGRNTKIYFWIWR